MQTIHPRIAQDMCVIEAESVEIDKNQRQPLQDMRRRIASCLLVVIERKCHWVAASIAPATCQAAGMPTTLHAVGGRVGPCKSADGKDDVRCQCVQREEIDSKRAL